MLNVKALCVLAIFCTFSASHAAQPDAPPADFTLRDFIGRTWQNEMSVFRSRRTPWQVSAPARPWSAPATFPFPIN